MLFLNRKLKASEVKKQVLQNPKILEVNLIKDEIKVSFDWSKNLTILLFVLFITGLLLAEIYFGLDWWEKQEGLRAQVLEEKVAQVDKEISKLKSTADAAVTYKDKTIEVTNLLNNHIYWSNFLSWLEKNTLSSVKFGSFKGDLTGIYNFAAKAPSYADVSWQVKAFLNSSSTKSVKVTSASLGQSADAAKAGEVSFNLKLEVKPEILKK
ncbi:MAG: hypothetical protein WC523_03520 [Patescibacteria group bacterium]|jgi:hypothetical protein